MGQTCNALTCPWAMLVLPSALPPRHVWMHPCLVPATTVLLLLLLLLLLLSLYAARAVTTSPQGGGRTLPENTSPSPPTPPHDVPSHLWTPLSRPPEYSV